MRENERKTRTQVVQMDVYLLLSLLQHLALLLDLLLETLDLLV